jgi:hypothetical protein
MSPDPQSAPRLRPALETIPNAMHTFGVIWIILLMLLQCPVYSQVALPEKDLATLTVEEGRQAAKAVDTGQNVSRLVNAALRAERLDLIAVYLETTLTNGFIRNYVRTQMPASTFKDRIVILILKSPLGWSWEPDRLPYGHRGIAPSIDDEPFGSVIKRHLPGHSLTNDIFESKVSRLELASQLEKALPPDSEAKSSQPEANPLPTPSAPASSAATPPAPQHPAASVVQTPVPAVERQAIVWPWVAGIAALTVIALLVWKRRA